ncbi:uncharacterized protein LOC135488041 isoform X1 [Lineus longissimus]|uniref:uncharacterized protein LOC135488041 isoform X1 n=1 Tax=Lineus longissimus TaxID=88925 RepID=UPI002B4E1453
MSQPRVILWAHPRSRSTAFYRSMWTVDNIKITREPFKAAYLFGSERVSKRYLIKPVEDGASFLEVKNMIERAGEDNPDASCIFYKDLAYYLHNRLDTPEFIPKGYVHAFLIRNPRDAIMSMHDGNMRSSEENKDLSYDEASFYRDEVGLEHLWQLYTLMTEQLGEKNILIMDADDLLNHPESVLREFCRRTGIPFSKRMVEWGETPEHIRTYSESDYMRSWIEPALKSTGFKRFKQQERNLDDYPDEVKNEIDRSLPFYKKLYALRYVPCQ